MKNVALVLSSGGARGLAHIGVIEELEANGYRIKSIAGSSIGAVIGGFYAAGKLNDYREWIKTLNKIDIFKLMDFTISKSGVLKGERLFNELQKILTDLNIEDLPIPLAISATDMIHKSEVVFRTGNLLQAMRASVAVPTLFLPVEFQGNELLDGGIINPIPISNVERSPNDFLVVVNLNSRKPYTNKLMKSTSKSKLERFDNLLEPLKQSWQSIRPMVSTDNQKFGYFDIMNRSFDLMQDKLSDCILEKYNPDIVVEISRESAGILEFYKAEELINEGKNAFREAFFNC
jgi:NTE family protein